MKWVLRIVGGLLLLLVLAVGGVALYLNQIASTAIEKGGTRALGVRTSVSGVLLRPISGSARIFGLQIANPPGFEAPNFLTLGHGSVTLATDTLRSSTIEVPQIELEQIELDLERRGGKLNTDALLARMHKSSKEPAPAKEQGGGPSVVVRELLIRDVTAHVDLQERLGKYGRLEVRIPEIRLANVGAADQNGADMAELTNVVVAALLSAIAKHGAGLPLELTKDLSRGLGNLASVPYQIVGDVTGGVVDASGQLLGATAKGLEDVAAGAGKGAEEATKRAAEGVKGAAESLGGLLKPRAEPEE